MTSGFIAPTNMISVILPVGYRITWSMTTYGAITPRTSEDLTKPDARSHPSSSFANFLAENQNMHVIIFFLRKKFFWGSLYLSMGQCTLPQFRRVRKINDS